MSPSVGASTASAATSHRENNFNALRLIAAMLVLVGHSFIFLGLPEPLFLGRIPLGPLGVYIFFAISGYLVSQSWEHDPQIARFFHRRALRIFPALILVLLLSVLVLGPLYTTLPIKTYFTHDATLGYFSNAYLYITYYLPGVFEKLRVPNAVNGSLWSLPVEFFMYILLAAFGLLGKRFLFVLLAVGFAYTAYAWAYQTTDMLVIYRTDTRQVFLVGIFFWVGVVYQRYRVDKYFSWPGAVMAAAALYFASFNNTHFVAASWICIPYLALTFGLGSNRWISKATKSGDYSYGVYIYAFPVQQAVVQSLPNLPVVPYILLCSAITLALAAMSWHLVEQNALSFKPKKPAPSTCPKVI